MAGMPEMQEHFPASAMDGGYAGNAGAIFRRAPWMSSMPEMQEHFPASAMGMTGMLKMQEQSSAARAFAFAPMSVMLSDPHEESLRVP
jgi:hypothetical protein